MHTFQTLLEAFCQYTELSDIKVAYVNDVDIRDDEVIYGYPFTSFFETMSGVKYLITCVITELVDGKIMLITNKYNDELKFEPIPLIMVDSLISRHHLKHA